MAAWNASPLPRSSTRRWLLWCAILAFVVFLADDWTGSEISFSLFYLVPVALAAWRVGLAAGVAFSIVCTVGWVSAYLLNRQFYSHPAIAFWNASVEIGVYLTVALALSNVRRGYDRVRALSLQVRAAFDDLDAELRSVGELQRSLLPAEPPRTPGLAVSVHYATSTRAGGDYFDFLSQDGGRLAVLIADASGHGTPAAVLMSMTRILTHVSPPSLPPEELLATLNARLKPNIPEGQFVTACSAVFDPATRRLEYAIAGHNPPLLVRRATGGVTEFENPRGLPLGVFPQGDYRRRAVTLEPGDTVLLYTDGLTEAMDPERRFFGLERVERTLAAHRGEPPNSIRDALLLELESHVGFAPQSDDVTLILLQAE